MCDFSSGGNFILKIIEICQELTKEIPTEQIFMNEPMNKHTTFKVGGNADIFVKVRNIKELMSVIKIAKKNDIHMTIIGNGSNILVKDKGIRGIVVKIEFEQVKIEKIEENNVLVTVGSGVSLAKLAQEFITSYSMANSFEQFVSYMKNGGIK